MKRTLYFSAEDLKRIESSIAEAETRTRGEIVAMVVSESSEYRWVRWAWAAAGWAVASAVACALERGGRWTFNIFELLEWQILGLIAGTFLSFLRPLRRLVLPERLVGRRVHREALANFMAAGLHETDGQTGILVYISELEKRVQILADRGIHGHAGEPYWDKMVKEIAAGIRAGRAADAVCHAIERMGSKLAEHFPPHPGEKKELSNEVRLGPAEDG